MAKLEGLRHKQDHVRFLPMYCAGRFIREYMPGEASVDRPASKPQGKLAQVLVRPEAALAEPKTPNSMVKTSKMMVRMTRNCQLEHRVHFHAFPSPEVIHAANSTNQDCIKLIHATGSELAQV